MSTYPSVISTITNPQANERLNSPSHSSIEQAQNDGIKKLETFVGTLSSTAGTLIYDIRSADSNGGGHVQSANKGGTGQIAYTKGDMLVATSSSVVSKFAVGSDDQVIIADATQAAGIKWGNTPGFNVQSFVGSVQVASAGLWNKPSGLSATSRVFVQLWGGGGSGSAKAGTEESGGGGGGGYSEGWFIASLLGETEQVVVGSGGRSVLNAAGGSGGGITVFGTNVSYLTAYAGGAGQSDTAGGGGGGGGGIFGTGSDANGAVGGNAGAPGSVFGGQGGSAGAGGRGIYSGGGGANGGAGGNAYWGGAGGGGVSSTTAGAGGTSPLGGNGGRGSISGAGGAGSIPGGGGGAAYSSTQPSGPGGPGMAIIVTFR